ncbi:MAG: ABC transporter ATP-binding protein/permease [Clostridiales Family XIII bacterium]|jgi:putative ABC transport system permease protein|nr:ABC transporter ATP-binding protein/permease [Clostridiales Family XIII bacterium]
MLELSGVTKEYVVGEQHVHALKGVNIRFRSNEFVSILGPSGGGKTTLLNIIGGLDHYTTGDMVIAGRSTKKFKSKDWDAYRNHKVGFVFQSYNLIGHQSVLANVELALTISGVGLAERRRRATEALERVGLGDQLKKKPNQLSGGQMQRVAIARALVNDPEIMLADEPTGALDTVTSVQIMELLKEIAQDRLVIMVTHNPELAEEYSTRIVKLRDGEIIDDSRPFSPEVEADTPEPKPHSEKAKMTFFTALRLSINNLMTKKGRTFMVAFAGSIGIIGIAMILSLSNGVNAYIDSVEQETLASYPLTVESSTVDMSAMMSSFMGMNAPTDDKDTNENKGEVTSKNIMSDMIDTLMGEIKSNDLKSFKTFLESDKTDIKNYTDGIQYSYTTPLNVYKEDTADGAFQVNPSQVLKEIGMDAMMGGQEQASAFGGGASMMGSTDIWTEMIGSAKVRDNTYDVIEGRMPENYDEIVIVTTKDEKISDYTLYTLGLLDITDIKNQLQDIMKAQMDAKTDGANDSNSDADDDDNKIKSDTKTHTFSYDELLEQRYRLLVNTDYYEKNDTGMWIDKSDDADYIKSKVDESVEIKVVGIVKPSENTSSGSEYGYVAYTPELMTHLIDQVNDAEIVKDQKADETLNVFTDAPFASDSDAAPQSPEDFLAQMSPEQQQQFMALPQEQQMEIMSQYSEEAKATYEDNLTKLGVSDLDNPSSIALYPKDFEAKEDIIKTIDKYNDDMTKDGKEDMTIKYTDIVGTLMKSVTTIINAITYILVAFVAISLVVSSIMIGIITYISVLERTKEIGILRSLGASKHDVASVFNAESLFIGFTAGLIGVLVSVGLSAIASIIVENVMDISNIAILPVSAGIVLMLISMFLTFIAGLLPSKMAARRDPVTALRSE